MCILVEFHNRIYSKATPDPKPMMKIFDLNTPGLINHMMRQGNFKKQEFPHSYKVVINRSEFLVCHINTHPVQFSLLTLPRADTSIDKQGSGWNETNIEAYFNVIGTDEGNGGTQRHKQMTTSQQFEVHHIMLWTVRDIRITNVKKEAISRLMSDENLSTWQCQYSRTSSHHV
jgi:hypothetical protein